MKLDRETVGRTEGKGTDSNEDESGSATKQRRKILSQYIIQYPSFPPGDIFLPFPCSYRDKEPDAFFG